MRKNRISLIVLLFVLAGINVQAQTPERFPLPEGLFYYMPAATVHGVEAAWVNPSALASFNFSVMQGMVDYEDGNYAKSWGVAMNKDKFALAYRSIYNPTGNDYKEWIYAGGMNFGSRLYVGVSYRKYTGGPALFDGRHFWNIALSGKTQGKFSWAAVFSNLNRNKINNEQTETEMRYSLGYRPAGSKFTLAADMFLSTGTKLGNADYVYSAEYRPIPGLYLNGLLDSDNNYQFGIRVNMLEYFVGDHTSYSNSGSHNRSTAYFGKTSQMQTSVLKRKSRRLRLSISGNLQENPPQPIFGRKQLPFVRLLLSIYRAADDPTISELHLNLRALALGLARAGELRDAISYFKTKGKKVTSYIKSPGNITYYVASVSDKIIAPPVSEIKLTGLAAELTFYGKTLDKLGINADMVRIGDYKSAPERYTQNESSDEYKEQLNRILDDYYDQLVSAIAQGRSLSIDSVKALIDQGPFTTDYAKEVGLIDGVEYYKEFRKEFLEPIPEISLSRYIADTLATDEWETKSVIAIVVAEGEITSSSRGNAPFSGPGGVTPSLMHKALARAATDPDISGVILRINSPGGAALAGEAIHRSVSLLAKRKPLMVSMANTAASGGYYIATPAERLFALSSTITGSIGIYGGKPDLSKMYEEIGLSKELYLRGKNAGMMSSMRPFSEDERNKYYSHLKAFYDHFVDLVAENRSLDVDSIDALSRGRIWTGREAKQNGLIDEIGGLKQALESMSELLGVDDYRVEILPHKRPWFIWPGRSLVNQIRAAIAPSVSKGDVQQLTNLFSEDEYMFTRLPFDIVVE